MNGDLTMTVTLSGDGLGVPVFVTDPKTGRATSEKVGAPTGTNPGQVGSAIKGTTGKVG